MSDGFVRFLWGMGLAYSALLAFFALIGAIGLTASGFGTGTPWMVVAGVMSVPAGMLCVMAAVRCAKGAGW